MSLLVQEMLELNLQLGNMFMEVLLLPQNSLMLIHSNTCFVQLQPSFRHAGLVFPLKMPAEPTMLTNRGLLNLEEDTLLH